MATPITFATANSQDMQTLSEAMRRRAGQAPSSAGIAGGAPAANAVTPANPIAQTGQTPAQQTPTPGAAGFPSGDGIQQLKQTKTGESELIVKALSDRLKKIGEGTAVL